MGGRAAGADGYVGRCNGWALFGWGNGDVSGSTELSSSLITVGGDRDVDLGIMCMRRAHERDSRG